MTSTAAYAVLLLAVICEVTGTAALAAGPRLTRLVQAAIVAGGYGAALTLLSFVFRVIPMGVVYALWSGIGMVLVIVAGAVLFGQRLGPVTLAGIGLILAGVLVLHLAPDAGQ